MIIHKLISHHLKNKDDGGFYELQAADAKRWILAKTGISPGSQLSVLDLGCGHGVFGREFVKLDCDVTFADRENHLFEDLKEARFVKHDIETDDIAELGSYDLVLFSNVLEHIGNPEEFVGQLSTLLRPEGYFYLSWTNWLSPWGGHDFSPFHYLGPRLGVKVWSSITGRKTGHIPHENLFPTYIGKVKSWIKARSELEIVASAPRYYNELPFLVSVPWVREFWTWNCVFLLRKKKNNFTTL